MREIKFRGKVRFNGNHYFSGQFVFGDYMEKNGQYFIFDKEEEDQYSNQRHVYVEVEPETVGQYTGLKDFKGKDVYEGDIVNIIDDGRERNNLTVEWSNEKCGFRFVDDEWNIMTFHIQHIEVIGNIHEEPK